MDSGYSMSKMMRPKRRGTHVIPKQKLELVAILTFTMHVWIIGGTPCLV